MNLPARADEVIKTLYSQNKSLANGTEDDRRTLTRMMAEQICFDLGKVWGTKASSSQAPPSKDGIAYKISTGVMDVFDWQNGTTREPQTYPGMAPQYPNVTGQYFIEVTPVDHLGGGGSTPTPPDNDLEERVATLEAQVAALTAQAQVYPYKTGLRSVQSKAGAEQNKVLSVWDDGIATANRDSVGIGEEFVLEVREWREVPK
jgi:hypothetical protein